MNETLIREELPGVAPGQIPAFVRQGMDAYDLGWLTGILEGEGCFDLTSKGKPRVRLNMSDHDVVRRAAMLMGVGTIARRTLSPSPTTGNPRKSQSGFAVVGWGAVGVMLLVLPGLGERRSARVREILAAEWIRRPTSKYNSCGAPEEERERMRDEAAACQS